VIMRRLYRLVPRQTIELLVIRVFGDGGEVD
jgi:hypothetical protein